MDLGRELIGVTVLDTIGLVIANADDKLRGQMALPENIRALGMISSRTGAAGQITACDDAVKSVNVKILSVEFPRDTKGWGGHGCHITVGAERVEDVRRAVEQTLRLIEKNAGEVHISCSGHLEFAYSANAGQVLHMAFGVPEGRAFGFTAGSPAAIGQVMADKALKAADINVCKYMTPSVGTSHSNEVILAFCGDASAVKEAVITAKETGFEFLCAMGSVPEAAGTPFLLR